jgi:FKBP-type peptidyl-prolyl cis-trans isomerase
LFYGIEGMRIGGKRVLKIAPHLAFRDKGVDGMIPPNAALEVEVTIHKERTEF